MTLLAGSAVAATTWWPSDSGRYRLSVESRVQPVPLNRMHAWVLQLQTTDGTAVTGAGIRVEGGMPAHDHGLPTAPQVTAELGDGEYLLEGLRFHMNGAWELYVHIEADGRQDRIVVPFTL